MIFYREKFKKIRESRGYTHSDISKKIGVSKQSVEHWEAGRAKPSTKRIPLLAKYLDCSISEISNLPPLSTIDSYSEMDEKLSFVVDSWKNLSENERSEIVGMVRAYSSKKEDTCTDGHCSEKTG